MTAAVNPPGYPLSAPAKRGAVPYRPRRGKKRSRVQVPEATARELRDDARETTARRRDVAAAAAEELKAEKAAKRASKSTTRAPKKAPKKTPKKTPKKAPKKAPKKTPKKPPKKPPRKKKTPATALAPTPTPAPAGPVQGDLFAAVNPVKRGPVSLDDLRSAVELGDLAELQWERDGYREQLRPSKKAPILWSVKAGALFFFGSATRRGAARDVPDSRERAVRQRWQGSQSTDAYTLTTSLDERAQWKRIGEAHSITYRSDKRGRTEPHVHDFGAGVRVYVKGPLWVVCGGKLRVTSRGLEG